MRITGSVPVDPNDRFTQRIKSIEQQVAELQRIKAWGAAWGKVALAKITTAHNGISTSVDVTGLSATWTAITGRAYRLSVCVIVLQNTSAGIADIRISDASNNTVQQSSMQQAVSGYATHTPHTVLTGLSAGSTTYKVRAATTAGTINVQMGATTPGILLVEDVGPA